MIPSDRKRRIGRAFGAAENYDRAADVQRLVAGRLADRIADRDWAPGAKVLEIGCGTGFLHQALAPRLEGAEWIVSDLSPAMVARCRRSVKGQHFLAMDGERPAFAGERFDLICASLAVQWFTHPAESIAGLFALLRPGGLLAFSTMGAESFAEWRAAHGALEAGTPRYPDPRSLIPSGADAAIEEERLPRDFPNARAFLRHLKAIGAGVPVAGRRPLTPAEMRGVMRRFEDGGGVATYHVAYCVLGKPAS